MYLTDIDTLKNVTLEWPPFFGGIMSAQLITLKLLIEILLTFIIEII